MTDIAVFTLTSPLHDPLSVVNETEHFLAELGIDYELRNDSYDEYGKYLLNLIYVRTGGTEGIFKDRFNTLRKQSKKFYLLTSGKSNSLAASMEILSYLRQQGADGEILHGNTAYLRQRIGMLVRVEHARRKLFGCRLGVIGRPSDWLISSIYNPDKLNSVLGISLVDISIDEIIDEVNHCSLPVSNEVTQLEDVRKALPGAEQIYVALRNLVQKYQLQGFTIRCFDLLSAVKNTGCLALARLNGDGIVAGCEGDVPSMLSMMVARSLTGSSGFQANPARINPESGELLFAHCTIPLDMVDSYELDTHFESGIGVGVRGFVEEGPMTIFKLAGDLSRMFVAQGTLIRNQAENGLCRTQQVIRLNDARQAKYFLTNPIGNHHIIMKGNHQEELEELLGMQGNSNENK
jgi:L-fucose isomerase-like protein